LNVVPIHVPPLRERREDIPALVRHFAQRQGGSGEYPVRPIQPSAVERLQAMDWPGNVRELRNTVERLLILAAGPEVTESDVAQLVGGGETVGLGGELAQADTFSEFKDMAEKAFILRKLREHDWNVSETARAVEMPRSNLYKKIERYGLVRED
jgi:two-component system nitrogen regulation response regulator NtrX